MGVREKVVPAEMAPAMAAGVWHQRRATCGRGVAPKKRWTLSSLEDIYTTVAVSRWAGTLILFDCSESLESHPNKNNCPFERATRGTTPKPVVIRMSRRVAIISRTESRNTDGVPAMMGLGARPVPVAHFAKNECYLPLSSHGVPPRRKNPCDSTRQLCTFSHPRPHNSHLSTCLGQPFF